MPLARDSPTSRLASTARCTCASAAPREYSTWCAAVPAAPQAAATARRRPVNKGTSAGEAAGTSAACRARWRAPPPDRLDRVGLERRIGGAALVDDRVHDQRRCSQRFCARRMAARRGCGGGLRRPLSRGAFMGRTSGRRYARRWRNRAPTPAVLPARCSSRTASTPSPQATRRPSSAMPNKVPGAS